MSVRIKIIGPRNLVSQTQMSAGVKMGPNKRWDGATRKVLTRKVLTRKALKRKVLTRRVLTRKVRNFRNPTYSGPDSPPLA